jgi:hypothetical protein
VLSTIINTISSMITLPLYAAVLTIIYYDLRVRKEGFDLSLLARGVGTSAPTGPADVAASSGLGGYDAPASGGYQPPGGGFAPPEPGSGGFAPPQSPSTPPPSTPPPGYGPPQPAPDQPAPSSAPDQPASPPPQGPPSAPDQPPAQSPPAASPPQAPPSPPEQQQPPGGPAPGSGLQSGDPLAPPPERREGDG